MLSPRQLDLEVENMALTDSGLQDLPESAVNLASHTVKSVKQTKDARAIGF